MRKFAAWFVSLLMLCSLATAEGTITPLPIDFTPGHVADPALFTEDSYQDDSLSITLERVWVGKARFNVARIQVADPSQLRVGLAAPFGKNKTNRISTIAKDHNAVLAIGGDYYADQPGGLVVRMGETYLKKPMKSRDMLIIDEKGDFHIIQKSDAEELKAFMESDRQMINVFNFGPALVKDGEKLPSPEKYVFNIDGKEPRTAIGQLGEKEYLMVMVDGRGAADSEGCTMETLAQFMFDQGCVQAYNLDGGNSALMVFNGENYSKKSFSAERSVSDIIYIATAVDFGLDSAEEK